MLLSLQLSAGTLPLADMQPGTYTLAVTNNYGNLDGGFLASGVNQ